MIATFPKDPKDTKHTNDTKDPKPAKVTNACAGRACFVRFVLFVAFVLPATAAHAQELLPRFDFHLEARYLTSADPRFNWTFDFGADIDVARWQRSRAVFRADYEALAGEQFRRFDVNQSNYLLEGGILFRVAGMEIGPIWHHVSRHLSDRAKRFPIDWNMLAARAAGAWDTGATRFGVELDARKTVTNIFVDYDWEVEATARTITRLTTRYAFVGSGGLRIVAVDGSRERGTQAGGRADAGLRLSGRAASAELFAGVERRIDPYALEFATATWFLAGLRLTSVP